MKKKLHWASLVRERRSPWAMVCHDIIHLVMRVEACNSLGLEFPISVWDSISDGHWQISIHFQIVKLLYAVIKRNQFPRGPCVNLISAMTHEEIIYICCDLTSLKNFFLQNFHSEIHVSKGKIAYPLTTALYEIKCSDQIKLLLSNSATTPSTVKIREILLSFW